MIVDSINNNSCQIAIYESATAMKAHLKAPKPATAPDVQNIFVGTKYSDMLKNTTDLNGMSLAEMNMYLAEKAVMEAIDENPKVIQRTKFDKNDWK